MKAAVMPKATLAPRLIAAVDISPFCSSCIVAILRVENVVYDPKKPTAMNTLVSSGQSGFEANNPNNKPRRKEPLTFAMKVPIRDEPIWVKTTWSTV